MLTGTPASRKMMENLSAKLQMSINKGKVIISIGQDSQKKKNSMIYLV